MSDTKQSGLSELKGNLLSIKDTFIRSVLRSGRPTSDKSRSAAIVNNFFLHIQGAKTHINTLRPSYTLGLGLISFFLFIIVVITGVFLMVFYNPGIDNAYNTIKDINYVVTGGKLMRNVHKWAGEGMIIFVILHMARVFFTSAYKKGREFNWLIGIVLFTLVLGINLSGYMLPWDQLAYWALVIVANIVQSPKELTDALGITKFFDIGGASKEFFLGGLEAGQESLTRVYFLHIMLFPMLLYIFIGIHFWRIRKDGGLTKPDFFEHDEKDLGYANLPEKEGGVFPTYKTYGLMELAEGKTPSVDRDVENSVLSWPNLLIAEIAVFVLTLAAVMIYSFYIDAPLRELANPLIPENPAKAPWYFLGLQELLSYSAFMGGVGLPGLAILGLALIPYVDRNPERIGVWFTSRQGKIIAFESFIVSALVVIGILVFVVNFGWFRNWWPNVPQLLIILINPGNIWVGFMIVYSIWVVKRTDSVRMGAISLFVMFLVSFVIFTYFGTEMRGPNWDFFWSTSQWPVH